MFQRGDGRGADAEFPETERHEALRGARVGGQFAAHPGFDTRPVRGVEHHADAALHGRVECVAKVGNVRVMFPMIASVGEFRAAKAVVETCMAELDAEGVAYDRDIALGVMIETPAEYSSPTNWLPGRGFSASAPTT